MAIRICKNGHKFEKTSSCPVCPICSAEEMNEKFGGEFPKIGAPASRALDSIGISRLQDLTKYSQEDLLQLHGFGPKALRLLHEALRERNLSFKKN